MAEKEPATPAELEEWHENLTNQVKGLEARLNGLEKKFESEVPRLLRELLGRLDWIGKLLENAKDKGIPPEPSA